MIDLHCHILPGIDDGPATLEESLELARIAVADGITHAVVTPHIHPQRFDNNVSTIEPVFNQLKQALDDQNIALKLHSFAAELRISAEMLSMIPAGQVPFLGEWEGKKVLLLELPHSHIPPGSDKLTQWLLKQNIQPMIAHPERNKEIMRNTDKLAPFVEQGCLFQLTAMSVTGEFGELAQKKSIELLSRDWITILATDAHNSQHRPPVLSRGLEAAAEIVGAKNAVKLVLDHPAKILGMI